MKILVLCTGNSCRSQMAEAFLKSFDNTLEVYSAGTNPSDIVHPKAIQVMAEIGIDLSKNITKSVDLFLKDEFDYVITVCGGAKESCPAFIGNVKHRFHIGFDDPAEATGTNEEVLNVFRRIRDEIKYEFYTFYQKNIRNKKMNGQKVQVEIQYFNGCPHCKDMIKRVRTAVEEYNEQVEYKETLVETTELARQVKFRGSPTVLVNGIDIENMPEPTEANLACRFYQNGLPPVSQIKEFIADQLLNEEK